MEVERLPSGVFIDLRQHLVTREPDLRCPWDSAYPSLPIYKAAHIGAITQQYLPLLDVVLDIDVDGTIASSKLVQQFTNYTELTIKEALYSFPLYNGSVVTSFRCW